MTQHTAPITERPAVEPARIGRLVQVRDTELFVQQSGSGPVLLFVHGMCGDADVWADQVSRLSDAFTCVTYDRRGHSMSPAGAEDQSYATHADDAAALISALGVEGCTLVGSSGGAYTGFELLRRHPGRVSAAVLSEPPLFQLAPGLAATVRDEIAPAVQAAADAGGPAAAVDAFFRIMCPGLWGRLGPGGKQRYLANAATLFPALTAPAEPVSAADLSSIDIPVLLLTGADSHPVLRTVVEVLQHRLPNAAVVEIPWCGHVTYAEQPEAFAAAVREFAGPRSSR